LIILDGWGYREDKEHNAVFQAKTPFFDYLWDNFPHSFLSASGESVGLPLGQMGNSEVGHITIGAGKIIDTDLVRISKAAASGEFISNHAFVKLFEHVKNNNSTLHIQGLIGPGGIHSHSDHLKAFLKAAKDAGVEKIAIDAFTDGRDTPPQSAALYLKEIEDIIDDLGIGFIATASGRFYAMDRDNNWDRLKKAEEAIFDCQGHICKNRKPSEVVQELYRQGVLDEHLEPLVFLDDKNDAYPIRNNDGVLFFNFRADRARMLSRKILEKASQMNLCFITMTEYNKEFDCLVAFPSQEIETTLAGEVSKAGLSQAHIAETEKFAHATYFLNGGKEDAHENEKHIMLESYKDITTHDQKPEMRAEAIADKAIEEIKNGTDFIFINFANPDMVGHTANVPAIIKALEEVDKQLKRVVMATEEAGGVAFITADHGNAELNVDLLTGEKHTAHTTNLVPAIITKKDYDLKSGGLADITPTLLKIMKINQPKSMTGTSLI
ncbi:MAG: 2,3-bisphosphoglycerate-independent phosphoglycerate mutase, partial [Candidatus Buchananbacteria bacterium]|nr:2,3-bisphosphoglycerate-independent phosphoglycerate mutase [Candidatus Buchananbacteria bacterium]